MKRKSKLMKFATCLVTGAYLLQAGGCFTIAANSALAAFPLANFLDENQLLFGVFAPCGTPNVIVIDQNGQQQGEIFNSADDLIFFCPITVVQQTEGGGAGG